MKKMRFHRGIGGKGGWMGMEREREGGRRSGDPQTHETTQASSTSSDPSSSPPHIYGGE